MCDVRVWYLKTLDQRQVLFPFIWATGLTVFAVYGMTKEKNTCADTTKIWLMGAIAREWLWTLVIFGYRSGCCATLNVRLLKTVSEGLSIYGIVWAMLMAIAVLPMYKCSREAPVLFSCCVVYIGCFILHFFGQVLVIVSLSLRPPRFAADREYLVQRRIRFGDDGAGDVGQNENINPVFSESWKEWLEKYGSYETVVPPRSGDNTTHGGPVNRPRLSTAETDLRTSSGEGTMLNSSYDEMEMGQCCGMGNMFGLESEHGEICVICLQPLSAPSDLDGSPLRKPLLETQPAEAVRPVEEMSPRTRAMSEPMRPSSQFEPPVSVVVRFPCRAAHCFHADCLHKWLAANTTAQFRRQRRNLHLRSSAGSSEEGAPTSDLRELVTCPVCRERPVSVRSSAEGSTTAGGVVTTQPQAIMGEESKEPHDSGVHMV
jgi:hypothetical protein